MGACTNKQEHLAIDLLKKIEIYDISSRKITQQIIATDHKFYRDNIANGLYIYRLFNERNLEIENGKIIFE